MVGGEGLEQIAYKSCESPIPGSVQGLMKGFPAHDRGLELDDL